MRRGAHSRRRRCRSWACPQISLASSSLNWTTTMRSCTSSLRVPLQSVDEPVPNEKEFMSVLKEMSTEISIWSSSPCLAYRYALSALFVAKTYSDNMVKLMSTGDILVTVGSKV